MVLGLKFSSLLFCLFLFSACVASRPPIPAGVVPEIPASSIEDEQYGHQVLQELTNEFEIDYANPRNAEVQSVVDKLVAAVPTAGSAYQTKASSSAPNTPWHVYIFKAPQIKNAAATRGQHLFIWSGMLDATKNEAELATILSHEISHVLAKHTGKDPNEELRRVIVQIGALAAGITVSALSRSPSYGGDMGRLTMDVTQMLGKGLIELPYSRERELEADRVGLFLMADAGYDPRSAVDFWSRIDVDQQIPQLPAFLSTHPPTGDRLEQLKQILPLAEQRYRQKYSPGNQASGNQATISEFAVPD